MIGFESFLGEKLNNSAVDLKEEQSQIDLGLEEIAREHVEWSYLPRGLWSKFPPSAARGVNFPS